MEQIIKKSMIGIRLFLKIISRLHRDIYKLYIHYIPYECGKNLLVFPKIRISGGKFIMVGNNVTIRKGTTIAAQTKYHGQIFNPQIIISDGVDLGEFCFITSTNSISIGCGTTTGRMVTITDNAHGESFMKDMQEAVHNRPVISKGPVFIGKNVWIGDKATILPNVRIGDGAIIGANAVVSKDVPEYCVAVGIPARIIKRVNNAT